MGRKKTTDRPPPAESTDRHKPNRPVRVPLHLAEELDRIAEEEYTTFPTQVILAVKMYLQHKKARKPSA